VVESSGKGSLVAAAAPSDQSAKGHHQTWQASADDRAGDGIYAELDIAGGAELNVADLLRPFESQVHRMPA
jgi:hypothetical protein